MRSHESCLTRPEAAETEVIAACGCADRGT